MQLPPFLGVLLLALIWPSFGQMFEDSQDIPQNDASKDEEFYSVPLDKRGLAVLSRYKPLTLALLVPAGPMTRDGRRRYTLRTARGQDGRRNDNRPEMTPLRFGRKR